MAVETDDATGLARRVGAVRLGGRLEEATPVVLGTLGREPAALELTGAGPDCLRNLRSQCAAVRMAFATAVGNETHLLDFGFSRSYNASTSLHLPWFAERAICASGPNH